MIHSYKDYLDYLNADKKALHLEHASFLTLYFHDIWKFQKTLRTYEYLLNCHPFLWQLRLLIIRWHYKKLSLLLGFSISPNSCRKGLQLGHYGDIVINGKATLGEYCTIAGAGVLVGEDLKNPLAPQIGNSCYLGPGCKIIGPIQIADGVTIAANAVVVKDIVEPYITVGGIPAHKISSQSVKKQ